ncbi:hypothetical protein ACO0R3_002430 [Hanseniaspora guilliermondii]
MIAAIILFILLLAVYNYLIYPFFLNSLNLQKLPGPYHYKFSKFFIYNKMRKEQGMLHIHHLHEKYGPIVQVSPNEVSIIDRDTVKKIYLNDNYPKEFIKGSKTVNGFYSQFGNFSNRNLFSTGDTKEHINKKKNLQKIYSKTYVLKHSDFLSEKIQDCVNVLIANKGQDIDVYSVFGALAMDVVTGFEFGFNSSSTFLKQLDFKGKELTFKNEIFDSFRDSSSLWFWVCMVPQLYDYVAYISGKDVTMKTGRAWIWQKLQQVANDYTSEDLKKADHTMSLLFDKYDRNLAKIGSEIADHTLAGADTTQTTLTYLLWELSRPCNKVWKKRLHDEIINTFPIKDNKVIIDYNKLDLELPIMNAIIKENFRLHAAIPGSERRFVPPGKKLKVGGYLIMEGTVVSTQPFSLHRNKEVFGDKINQFNPERWLKKIHEDYETYENRIRTFEKNMMTFGQGNRMCLGMHLAVTEIKATVASFFGNKDLINYKISEKWCRNVVDSQSDVLMGYGNKLFDKFNKRDEYLNLNDIDKMRMADSYTIRPLYDECWITV